MDGKPELVIYLFQIFLHLQKPSNQNPTKNSTTSPDSEFSNSKNFVKQLKTENQNSN